MNKQKPTLAIYSILKHFCIFARDFIETEMYGIHLKY
jgi:hypothetical protein